VPASLEAIILGICVIRLYHVELLAMMHNESSMKCIGIASLDQHRKGSDAEMRKPIHFSKEKSLSEIEVGRLSVSK